MDDVPVVRVYSPDVVRATVNHHIKNADEILSSGEKGAITGRLTNAMIGLGYQGNKSNLGRYLVLGFLFSPLDKPFSPMSSKVLTDRQWYALKKWIGAEKNEVSGEWVSRDAWFMEVAQILHRARFIHDATQGMKNVKDVDLVFGVMKEKQTQYGEPQYRDMRTDSMIAHAMQLGGVVVRETQ